MSLREREEVQAVLREGWGIKVVWVLPTMMLHLQWDKQMNRNLWRWLVVSMVLVAVVQVFNAFEIASQKAQLEELKSKTTQLEQTVDRQLVD